MLKEEQNRHEAFQSSFVRTRRTRSSESLRNLVSETKLDARSLVFPLFVTEGSNIRENIDAMPGIFRISPDRMLDREIKEITNVGLNAVLLFGIPKKKDLLGSEAYSPDGVVQKAISRVKEIAPQITVIGDVCMCEYTDHGHCGIINSQGIVDNDKTIEYLGRIAVSQARAGADVIAPSAMMDNQVQAIRNTLDLHEYYNVPIMSYSSKYASAFYGPFREAAASAPKFGDRKSYQMDSPNVKEAVREAQIDVDQGADIVMVKPALAYLDVIRAVREKLLVPLAAYNVSGEYSMIKAAAARGWLDEERTVRETLIAIKRAGADIIITYFAKQFAASLTSQKS